MVTDDTSPGPPPATEAQTQFRMQLLLEVLNGRITGVQAAQRLGVSRKTWSEWQARGTQALCLALSDRPMGRPVRPRDPEKDGMRRELQRREHRIRHLEAALQLREDLRDILPLAAASAAAGGSDPGNGTGNAKKKPERGTDDPSRESCPKTI